DLANFASACVELVVASGFRVEAAGPVVLEVDGAGQHESGGGGELIGPQDGRDAAGGALVDPAVDEPAASCRVTLAVGLTEAGAVAGADEAQEGGEERVVAVDPQGGGEPEGRLGALATEGPAEPANHPWTPGVERPCQLTRAGVKPVGFGQVQGLGHLLE